MQFNKLHYLWLFVLIFTACKNQNNTEVTQRKSATIRYAKGFDIEHFEGYTELRINTPYPNATEALRYILVPKDQAIPAAVADKPILRTPVERVVVTSTTHVPMLSLLGLTNRLVGFPNTQYISTAEVREQIEKGTITELGKEDGINTELLLDLHPELVIGFSMNQRNKMFDNIEKSGIPVILNGDWLEETPLGRAEWLKFFGVLFGKDELASKHFNHIVSEYLAAKEIAREATTQPTVLSGVQFKDVWNLPAGESFVAQFLRDANANYLWQDSPGKGSLALNFEVVFDRAQHAEYWIAPGHYTSFAQLAYADEHYKEFDAFKHKTIFSFTIKKGANGGAIYYEQAAIQPHLVLKDLIHLFHPTLLPGYSMTFIERLND